MKNVLLNNENTYHNSKTAPTPTRQLWYWYTLCLILIKHRVKQTKVYQYHTSTPYFIKIMSILSKTRCSNVILFKFCMTNPLLSYAHIWSKKRQPCKHSPARKVNFTKKSMLPCNANILSKNFHSLKNMMFPCPILSKKPPFF